MFRSFFTTIFRGSSAVLCAVTIPPADLRPLGLYYYTICGSMCMPSVCVWCSLSLGDLLVNYFVMCVNIAKQFTSKLPIDKNTKHTQMTYPCGHILCNNTTQRTQISGRNSDGTKHSGGPPEDGREKRSKHIGVLCSQTLF
jgi:hypothetical protein